MSVDAVERAAAHAWPARERISLGEWVLSAGDGFSRRRNSTVPIGPVPSDLIGRMDDVAAWYATRGLPVLYRITPMCDPAVDDALDQRGFSIEAPVLVMTRSLGADEPAAEIGMSPSATEDWISTELAALGIDRSLVDPWVATIQAVPSPASFVTATHGTESVGAGFGVVTDDLLGIFEMAVRPNERRRGHARRMMKALHSFGHQHGAEQAFLQVVERDAAAVALYRSIGYEVSHRYWYRRDGLEGS
ncbi:MAG: GNAT family N-acetyltransferase [Actinomycetota bacterium]|nr:GNAT family N-acetyltransferase [Actinomycetota bacterium]